MNAGVFKRVGNSRVTQAVAAAVLGWLAAAGYISQENIQLTCDELVQKNAKLEQQNAAMAAHIRRNTPTE